MFKPFDTITVEFAIKGLASTTPATTDPARHGIDYRVLNGYMYLSPCRPTQEEIGARVPEFTERAGHYFANWDLAVENWETKVRRVIDDWRRSSSSRCPRSCRLSWIKEGRGTRQQFALAANYHRCDRALLRSFAVPLRVPQPRLCRLPGLLRLLQAGVLPGIADLGIAKMVRASRSMLFRPDEELKKLARSRWSWTSPTRLRLAGRRRGDEWPRWHRPGREVAGRLGAASQPWFNFSAGNGFYHTDKVWLDNPEIPLGLHP